MHLEKIRESQGGRFDRYVIGSLIIVFAFFVAQLPHTFAVINAVGLDQLGSLDVAGMLQALPSNTTLVLMLLPFALVAVLVSVLIRRLHNISIRAFITSRAKIDWKRIGFAFAAIVLLNFLFFVFSYYSNPSHFQWNFDPQAFAILFLIAIVLVPLQTSAEELFFRGYLMQGFGQVFKHRIFPLLITSLLFDFKPFTKQFKGMPDGLKIHKSGNIFATGPGGVHIISPAGKHLATVETGKRSANCAFDPDQNYLYTTTTDMLLRIALN